MRFEGKVVIITGGNAGIGLSAAKLYAAQGAKVVITGRRKALLDQISSQEGNIYARVADASNLDSVEEVVAFATEKFGTIDVLVNNVGSGCLGGLDQIDIADVQDVLNINVLYTMRMIQACLPLLENASGNVVNITSTYGHKPSPFLSAYGLSKAAVEHLTKSLAIELAPKGVRVNAIAPGPTESDFLKDRMGLPEEVIAQVKQSEVEKIPMGRRGVPEDVAHWIVEISSNQGSWITGHVFDVDGGLSST